VVAAAKPVSPKVASAQPASAPSIATSQKSAAPPVAVAAVPPVKAIAKPSQPAIESSSPPEEEEEPEATRHHEATEKTEKDVAQVQTELLQASLFSQIAAAGYPNLGVSVNADGDVFLDGTFLNQADQDRMIALIRANPRVRDIYFSGTVWYADHSRAGTGSAKAGASEAAPQQASAKSATTSEPAIPPRHMKIAHSEEFPVTAADETPAPQPAYVAPAAPKPTSVWQRTGIWPFRWPNNAH
jgi:hypothetical protein